MITTYIILTIAAVIAGVVIAKREPDLQGHIRWALVGIATAWIIAGVTAACLWLGLP